MDGEGIVDGWLWQGLVMDWHGFLGSWLVQREGEAGVLGGGSTLVDWIAWGLVFESSFLALVLLVCLVGIAFSGGLLALFFLGLSRLGSFCLAWSFLLSLWQILACMVRLSCWNVLVPFLLFGVLALSCALVSWLGCFSSCAALLFGFDFVVDSMAVLGGIAFVCGLPCSSWVLLWLVFFLVLDGGSFAFLGFRSLRLAFRPSAWCASFSWSVLGGALVLDFLVSLDGT